MTIFIQFNAVFRRNITNFAHAMRKQQYVDDRTTMVEGVTRVNLVGMSFGLLGKSTWSTSLPLQNDWSMSDGYIAFP